MQRRSSTRRVRATYPWSYSIGTDTTHVVRGGRVRQPALLRSPAKRPKPGQDKGFRHSCASCALASPHVLAYQLLSSYARRVVTPRAFATRPAYRRTGLKDLAGRTTAHRLDRGLTMLVTPTAGCHRGPQHRPSGHCGLGTTKSVVPRAARQELTMGVPPKRSRHAVSIFSTFLPG